MTRTHRDWITNTARLLGYKIVTDKSGNMQHMVHPSGSVLGGATPVVIERYLKLAHGIIYPSRRRTNNELTALD